jgi:hypothetical protein
LTARTLRVTIATAHEGRAMPSGPGERYDFFLSRQGSVAHIAQEVTDVLTEKGYKVLVQDYDIPLGSSFVEAMHEAIINSRDLIILFTEDYLRSPYTRKEFTSFEAERVKTAEERHIIVLRCQDVRCAGYLRIMSIRRLWASNVSLSSARHGSLFTTTSARRITSQTFCHPLERAC